MNVILADQAVPLEHLRPLLVPIGWLLAFVLVMGQVRLGMLFARLHKNKHGFADFGESDREAPSLLGIVGGQVIVLTAVPLAYGMITA
ncbi:hypothetical protein [Williamsia sterculiae]|uniref:Uncharacterized protein n=1 Tax=Williamsia sterculiae TaxID=1344003 RepID=A0A1N7HEW3_9NOCA|nr:hypothetical protein [Williamsia sterculiae]SIS23281.1 hypothetical protein SAMN05445060_4089 [Williamsia sterculiae]